MISGTALSLVFGVLCIIIGFVIFNKWGSVGKMWGVILAFIGVLNLRAVFLSSF